MDFKDEVIKFYMGTNYQELRKSVPRPKEWHLPLLIYENFNDQKDYFKSYKKDAKIIVPLNHEEMKSLRSTLLHESIFSYYKAFYNYLAAKNLYSSGAIHWIEITAYYAKFFLAQAINTLCGRRSYVINNKNHFFVEHIFKTLNSNKDMSGRVSYSMTLDFNIAGKNGELVFHKKGINSHADIWNNYSELDLHSLGLTKITYEEFFDNDVMHLSKQRNIENYSFEGYGQIDFNLDMGNFESYFERDFVKSEEELVYNAELGLVLGVISELHHLYKKLSINRLPVEQGKLEHMVSYMIDNLILKKKLLHLIKDGLPLKNEYIDEMNDFYSK